MFLPVFWQHNVNLSLSRLGFFDEVGHANVISIFVIESRNEYTYIQRFQNPIPSTLPSTKFITVIY